MSEDLGLFVHTFNDNNKYCFPSSQNLRQRIQMQIFEKLKPFSEFYYSISPISIKFQTIWEQR